MNKKEKMGQLIETQKSKNKNGGDKSWMNRGLLKLKR